MSAYRKRWTEILRDQHIPGWEVDNHGQAIVVKVSETDLEKVEKEAVEVIQNLLPQVDVPAEWLKFIFFNDKVRFQYFLNEELAEQR